MRMDINKMGDTRINKTIKRVLVTIVAMEKQ